MDKSFEEAKANSAIEGVLLRPEEAALFERMIALCLDEEESNRMIDAYLANQQPHHLAAE